MYDHGIQAVQIRRFERPDLSPDRRKSAGGHLWAADRADERDRPDLSGVPTWSSAEPTVGARQDRQRTGAGSAATDCRLLRAVRSRGPGDLGRRLSLIRAA